MVHSCIRLHWARNIILLFSIIVVDVRWFFCYFVYGWLLTVRHNNYWNDWMENCQVVENRQQNPIEIPCDAMIYKHIELKTLSFNFMHNWHRTWAKGKVKAKKNEYISLLSVEFLFFLSRKQNNFQFVKCRKKIECDGIKQRAYYVRLIAKKPSKLSMNVECLTQTFRLFVRVCQMGSTQNAVIYGNGYKHHTAEALHENRATFIG